MNCKLKFPIGNGKNFVFIYYLKNFLGYLWPRALYRLSGSSIAAQVDKQPDRDYIYSRVNYYNKLEGTARLSPTESKQLKQHRITARPKIKSRYFYDSYEITRYFNQQLRWQYLFGDIIHVPEFPSILKSRPIHGDNRNSVLLNLNKLRHFVFLNDNKSFREKENKVIFLAYTRNKPHRIKFIEMYHDNKMCICGDVEKHPDTPAEWHYDKISLWEHLRYKFIMALEGYDVATNLKWIMSSNSIAVMPRPTYETWFMEGSLIPNVHYIEIKSDFSDLEERLNYYITHPEAAEEIIRNANEYISQFKNKRRERQIAYLVMDKYLKSVNG